MFGMVACVPMRGDLGVDHGALAPADRRHVDRHGSGHRAKLRAVAHLMRDLCAPNLILGGQAGDVGTGAADPSPIHDNCPSPGLRQLPGQKLARLSAAQDQDFIPFRLRHARVHVPTQQEAPLRSRQGPQASGFAAIAPSRAILRRSSLRRSSR
jgi:hypothetical protein